MPPVIFEEGCKLEERYKKFIEVYHHSACNVSVSCKKFGITRRTFYYWYNKNPEFAEYIDSVNDSMIDFAESTLKKLIQGVDHKEIVETFKGGSEVANFKKVKTVTGKPDTASVIFFLKTKGKSRGYVEKQYVENINYNHEVNQDAIERINKLKPEDQEKLIEINRQLYD